MAEDDHAAPVDVLMARAFRTAFGGAPTGMAIVDERGCIKTANAAMTRITGFAPEELVGHSMLALIEPDDRGDDVSSRQAPSGGVSAYDTRLRLRRADGSSSWVALNVIPDSEIPPRSLIYLVAEISERLVLEGRLAHLIDHDFLTGLYNRRRFEQELEREVARQRRKPESAAMIMLDLDGFKGINDHFGHALGDELLRGLSAQLQTRVRTTDMLARLSGDEFALLLPDTSRVEAELVARDLIAIVRRHRTGLGSKTAQVTASVGVAFFNDLDEAQVAALADAAMYAAKDAGGDKVVVFTTDDRAMVPHSVGDANRIRRALRDHGFVLHCQPIRNLATGTIDQYELLIRMRGEADGELIPPSAFLYAAERFGLIASIDTWVVSQAVALIRRERQRGRRIVLAVNLSGRSIGDPGLAAHIDRELDESGIDPSTLNFELTETAAISNIEAARRFSLHLNQRGCGLALDDFGAGCASFHYLKSLPFDYIKIDGGFIRGLTQQPIDRLVVSAIVTIAKGMGKQTIAEFVGDQETNDLLQAHGVDYGQGFHIARPQPISDTFAGDG